MEPGTFLRYRSQLEGSLKVILQRVTVCRSTGTHKCIVRTAFPGRLHGTLPRAARVEKKQGFIWRGALGLPGGLRRLSNRPRLLGWAG